MDNLTAKAAEYAALLHAAGFTIYTPTERYSGRRPSPYFHYSREVDGVACFGTYTDGSSSFDHDGAHTMPLWPTRLNGSSAFIGAEWGDQSTLGLDDMPIESVEYATIVARPNNWCPVNAEPTYEATMRAMSGRGVPQRYYRGARLANAQPSNVDRPECFTVTAP